MVQHFECQHVISTRETFGSTTAITTSKMNGSYDKSHREHGHGHRFGMSMSLVWSFGFDV